MEVYVLDSLLRRIEVVDLFESMVWTERYSEIGDFELDLKSTPDTRRQFTNGTNVAINRSYRVMRVESVEDTTDENGKTHLKVKGRSLEALLEDRVIRDNNTDNLVDDPSFSIVGTPQDIATTMFQMVCVDGVLDLADIIPFANTTGSIYSEGTIPMPEADITWVQTLDTLYSAIKSICDAYDLGFRLLRNQDNSELIFQIYGGNDRTSRQTVLTPAIFSPNLENLQNTTEYQTSEKSKNVAYVYSNVGVAVVYGSGVDPDVAGFERRVMFVDASSQVTEDTPDIPGALELIGQQELAKNRALAYFDGELNEEGMYRYDVDYQLGDLVELRNVDGVISYKRVTEQIFVHDAAGERSYPTLTLDLYLAMVTWLSYGNKSTVWLDFDLLPDTWADMD